MSVAEINQVDAMGISKDGKGLILMISDHLDWNNEAEHLFLLQEKINAYLGYIEANEFLDVYPNLKFEYYIIELHFKYPITTNCWRFIKAINTQLEEFCIKVTYKVEV
ncbi:DUF6572 domain-containing protein [Acetivibrio clariflavus]|uniref:DUF6572 domain-containing protein n=1 Tax=Acetivibrio clariflavus TaxID=288965 RepID=UPI000483206D|nr:DUF6572 domain-containing protein [Acetivibrio clariflavus]